jgi:hypothetical protein
MINAKTGFVLATAAAALFALGTAPAAHAAGAEATVKCAGVNSCKGTSECKTAKNECKGQNSCKGQGWVSKASADACKKDGGTVVTK